LDVDFSEDGFKSEVLLPGVDWEARGASDEEAGRMVLLDSGRIAAGLDKLDELFDPNVEAVVLWVLVDAD
jgi:hypothetical protein